MILTLLQTDINPLWGVIIILLLLQAATLFGRKIDNNKKGHRYTEYVDDEVELRKAAENYVVKHTNPFIKKHYRLFSTTFMDGARHQRDKTL